MFNTDVVTLIFSRIPSLSLLKTITVVRAAIEPQAVALAATNASLKISKLY